MEILTDFGVNWSVLAASTVNFVILAIVLWYVMVKPLLALLEQRETTIRTSLERAELERQEAKVLETKVADDRKIAAERAQKIVSDAETKAAAVVKHANTEAETKAAAILTDAKKKAEHERTQLLNDATDQLADLVADATTIVVGKTVTAGIDRELVSTAITAAKQGR